MLTGEFKNFPSSMDIALDIVKNQDVTDPQKELIMCHWKLGIIMYRIQELMKYQSMEYPNGNNVFLPPFILYKLRSTSKRPVPVFTSCLS